MAHRSFQLRETLVHAKSEVRQHRQVVRQQSHQIDKVEHDKAQALQQQSLEFNQLEGQAIQMTHEKVRSLSDVDATASRDEVLCMYSSCTALATLQGGKWCT
jgi:hypothetical protein